MKFSESQIRNMENWSMRLELLSKYRKELFGICIIGVLAGHALPNMNEYKNTLAYYFIKMFSLIGVRGFVFLSGFGLYFSLKKNNSRRGGYKRFYEKRLFRVYIPYCCMGIPYFIWKYIVINYAPWKFLSFVFPISFWIYGNDAGMWYIDVILLFYLIFPFLYRCMETGKEKYIAWTFMFLGAAVNILLYCLDKEYYDLVEIGISKIPLLIYGAYAGKCAYEGKTIKWFRLAMVSVMWFSAYIIVPKEFVGYTWLCDVRSVLGCLYFTALLHLIKNKYVTMVLTFFGSLTLELYLLHLYIGDILSYYHIFRISSLRYCITIMLSTIGAYIFSSVYKKILKG